MLRLTVISLLLFASTCFSQSSNKKILGKWISCEKIETLIKVDNLSFAKEDTSVINKCVSQNCKYTQWTFEKNDTEQKILIYVYKGCKGTGTNSSVNSTATWSIDKKNILTIFDDKYTKHVFEVTFLPNEIKLKRIG